MLESTCSCSVNAAVAGEMQVEVVDPVEDYLATLKDIFDFPAMKELIARPDFHMLFDAMNAVTGAYAKPIFIGELGASEDSVMCVAA